MLKKKGMQAIPIASDAASNGRQSRFLSADQNPHVQATATKMTPVVCVRIAKVLQSQNAIQSLQEWVRAARAKASNAEHPKKSSSEYGRASCEYQR